MNDHIQLTRQQWPHSIRQALLRLDFPFGEKPRVCHNGLSAFRCYWEGMQIEKIELITSEVNLAKKIDSENTS